MKIQPLAVLLFLASTALLGQQYEIYRQFVWPGGPAGERPTIGADGNIYGTSSGGDFGRGEIFRLVPDGGGGLTYERLYSFHGPDGNGPVGLVQGTDGRFYGATAIGGQFGGGTVYAFDLATRTVVVFHSFPVHSFYGVPYASRLIQASDGNFYGLTASGGATGFGTIFRVTPSGDFTELHNFTGPDGERPWSGALLQASDGYLYGCTQLGGLMAAPDGLGLSGGGTLFRSDLAGNTTVLYRFPGENNEINAELAEGPDGNLYGTSYYFGASGMGSVFRSDKAGNVTVIHSFPASADDGTGPSGGLTWAPDGAFYGLTTAGGAGGGGTVYRMTTGGAVTTVASFVGGGDPHVVGYPGSSLVLEPAGTLLGISFWGGASGVGVMFRAPVLGSGYQVVHEYGAPAVATNPASPLVQTADGTLWGTAGGGTANLGTVYRLSGGPMLVHEFSGTTDGASPGELLAASDGSLYGVTASQGPGGSGTVFHLDADGTFTTLHPFSGPDGAQPEGGVMQASDGNFYGTTGFGGVNGGGTLFRLTSSGTHTKLHDFAANAIPEEPRGRIIQATDGMLYFTTFSSFSTLYRSDLDGNLTDLYDFIYGIESNPPDGVIQADDGNLYGTTRYWGGPQSLGSIFRFAFPSTFTHVYDFSGYGRSLGTVTQGNDGRLYGTATGDLVGGPGGVWVSDLSGANFQWIRQLSHSDGDTPSATLLRASDEMLYGVTQLGGSANLGLVFRVDLVDSPPSIADVAPASGIATGGVSLTISGDHLRPGLVGSVGGAPFAIQDLFDVHAHFAVTPPLAPGTLNDVTVTNTDGQFATLPQAYFADFLDAPAGSLFHDDIEAIFRDGITAGCGGGSYCGGAAVTRGQMAVFLLKEMHGSSYAPPACAGVFPDVPCPSMFADWIEELTAEGISAGCGGGFYCPNGFVPRANASVFLLKAEHGTKYAPPPCAGVFSDVACPSTYADWIEQLAAEGVTTGCGNGNYCPSANSTRGQMATFLEKTSGLP